MLTELPFATCLPDVSCSTTGCLRVSSCAFGGWLTANQLLSMQGGIVLNELQLSWVSGIPELLSDPLLLTAVTWLSSPRVNFLSEGDGNNGCDDRPV